MFRIAMAAFLLVLKPATSGAGEWKSAYDLLTPKTTDTVKVGRQYRVEVGDLRPTQFSVGLTEVNERAAHIRELGKHELHGYLKDHAGTAVIGPGGEIYLVDGHHVSLAASRLGGDRVEVLVKVVDDWSRLTREAFFARMTKAGRLWPYDEDGRGPLDPETLPETIHGLKNDPYRSLAYLVRKAGAIKDVDVPFLEFRWANYFRKLIPRSTVEHPAAALRRATVLAAAPEAAKLPGYEPHPPKKCELLLSP